MLKMRSPAKVNLFLRILRKRSDGYHELASLMQAISLCDQISYEPSSTDSLTSTSPLLPVDRKNLIWKAVDLFRKNTGRQQGLTIHLEKKIPLEAGLGGGSSNAATTLWALNLLFDTQLSKETLADWGAQIGSDVPFFFSQGTAFCTGRGEKVRDLPAFPATTLSLFKPNDGLSAAAVYGNLDLNDIRSSDPEELLDRFLSGKPCYMNDLEPPAFKLLPKLALLKEQIEVGGADAVLMSGSGTTFFAPIEFPKKLSFLYPLWTEKCHFLNRSIYSWY